MSRGSAGSRRVDRARLRGALKRILDLTEDDPVWALERIARIARAATLPGAPVCDLERAMETPEERAAHEAEEVRAKAQRERIAGILAASKARRDAAYPGYVPSDGRTPSTYDRAAADGAPWSAKRKTIAKVAGEAFKRVALFSRTPPVPPAEEWCEHCQSAPCAEVLLARRGR